MWDGVCPICQSRKIYGKRDAIGTRAQGRYSRLKLIGKWFLTRPTLELVTYVCARCGYVALTVPDEELESLEGRLQEWGWTPIEDMRQRGQEPAAE